MMSVMSTRSAVGASARSGGASANANDGADAFAISNTFRRSSSRRISSGSVATSPSLVPAFQSLGATATTKTKMASTTTILYNRSFLTTRRSMSSNGNDSANPTITVPNKTGDRDGLIRHEIIADDGHPLRLYSRAPRNSDDSNNQQLHQTKGKGRSILLLHGRTWSSQPVFDLRTSNDDVKQQSTLQSLADLGFHAYALDLRGFGETPRGHHDESTTGIGGYTTPRRCVADVKCAIDWITDKHHEEDDADAAMMNNSTTGQTNLEDPTIINTRPALLGWSQGALVAQMYAQQHGPSTLSDLVLFGSIYDPRVIYPRKPLYDPSGRLVSGGPDVVKPPPPSVTNTDIDSLEDFTLPGTICDEAALTFSKLALAVDPVKAPWDELHEFNVLNPALVHVPTLVLVGAQDPYVSWDAQRELFERLGTEDKSMCVLPGCDHAAHILKARKMFVRGVVGFLLRKDGF
eukprot:CAMPEP_0183705942 /NCGR_PEP_ID=MMETSP0737-20130205/2893_1 /TAXON_ID=385413 /ORGANISM="Thalassiosira miniscula, Strain CCMP1093" /LENGTH=461 /DNA_ID=CAMNT_0025933209 /DNA_START=93 /DNA_END=1478 /DNA_ORIENTATION=-